ncbi:hypothetical protein GN956_G9589 [Arapaima gigas]
MPRLPCVFAGPRWRSALAAVQVARCASPSAPRQAASLPRVSAACWAAQRCRFYSTGDGKDTEREGPPRVIVVGVPNPLTWLRNRILTWLIKLYFDINISSAEFNRGAKQALVQVSTLMSQGRFADLQGLVSSEALQRARTGCDSLTEEQRRGLAVLLEDIIFLVPEDVSLLYDNKGRKFCYVLMRFWYLSNADVPKDQESTLVLKTLDQGGGHADRKIVTAAYEFQMELTDGLDREWTVTNIWHWKQLDTLPQLQYQEEKRSSWGRPHVRSPVGDAVAGRGLRRENSSSAVVPSPGN